MSNPAPSVTKLFVKTFGTKPDALYQAPGRVNLIGEHTDYNEGLVLPAAINFHTIIAVKRRDDDMFRAVSAAFPGIFEWHYGDEGNMSEDEAGSVISRALPRPWPRVACRLAALTWR